MLQRLLFRYDRIEQFARFEDIGDLDFSYSQPLLRNFGREATERNLIVARASAAIQL